MKIASTHSFEKEFDNYWEHSQHHDTFIKDCSECYNENQLLKERTRRMREELGSAIGQWRADEDKRIRDTNPFGD